MNGEEGFVRALAANPMDETTALVFADWLDEHDNPRGELLRIQTALARWEPDWQKRVELQLREQQIIQSLEGSWLGGLRDYCRNWYIEHGLAHITLDARRFTGRRFAAVAREGFLQAWIGTVRLENLAAGNLDNLRGASWLHSLSALDLSCTELTDHRLADILTLPHLDNLTWLDLCGNQLTDHSVRLLASLPCIRRLRWLDLRNNALTGKGLPQLIEAFAPDERRHIDLHGNYLKEPAPVAGDAARVVNSIGMEFAPIPAGTFLMGSPPEEDDRHAREGPRHPVTLTRPYYLGVYPVTQEQYVRVMGTNPSNFSEASRDGGRHHPVDSISRTLAREFCRRLSALPEEKEAGRSYRLPTEAEWEHAARAGTSLTPFCFGASLSSRQANFDGTRPYGGGARGPNLRRSTPVGMYRQRNAFGLFDMYGNVWEWCADRFDEKFYRKTPAVDPRGPDRGENRFVLRGGGWYFYGMVNRAAFRGVGSPEYSQNFTGFRAALDIRP